MARILLVEDNENNQALFLAVLRRGGHEVELAADGEAALAAAERFAPELIVLDLSIPKVDGWTVARTLRAHTDRRLAELPILALTAHAMKGDRRRALEAGCSAYLSKPVSPRELAARLDEMLAGPLESTG